MCENRSIVTKLGKAKIIFVILLYSLLLVLLYHSALSYMIKQWDKPEYNYAYLVPFVILYLLWRKREKLVASPIMPSWKGIVPFVLGLAFFWLGELAGEYFSLYFSFWLVLVGLFWIHIGWNKMRIIIFPLFMILITFPLPYFIYNKISIKLQLISSQLGVYFLQFYGMPVYREGNIIDIVFTKLQVVEACSGIKTLISLAVLALLVVYLYKASLWKKGVIMISVVPIAILANSSRIAVTGILYEIWGAEVAEGFFHGFSGILIFMFSLCIVLLQLWILKWLPPRKSKVSLMRKRQGAWGASVIVANGEFHPGRICRTYGAGGVNVEQRAKSEQGYASHAKPFPEQSNSQTKNRIQSLFQPQFVVAVLSLSATFILSQGVDFREKIPLKKPFNQFPLHVGDWSGNRQTMEQVFIDKLDFSDYVIIDYTDRLGKKINFYVAYYESQRKGESIHSPGSCLPGSGWIFRKAGAMTVSIPGYKNGFIPLNRAIMEKNGDKQVSFYWFPARGRVLTNLYQLKIFGFWDALTTHRTDGALVRLITPVYESETTEDADQRLYAFTREIVPLLSDYIPGRDLQ